MDIIKELCVKNNINDLNLITEIYGEFEYRLDTLLQDKLISKQEHQLLILHEVENKRFSECAKIVNLSTTDIDKKLRSVHNRILKNKMMSDCLLKGLDIYKAVNNLGQLDIMMDAKYNDYANLVVKYNDLSNKYNDLIDKYNLALDRIEKIKVNQQEG